MPEDQMCSLYALFGDLLEYPTRDTLAKARQCVDQLLGLQPEAAALLEEFCRCLASRTLEQLEELYTSTFDMQPVCYPYVGYQLFGETYKRGAFMARLNEAYRLAGYSAAQELPDHASVVLRFLALDAGKRTDEFGRALVLEGLVPALKKMADALQKPAGNPYFSVVSALSILATMPETEMGHA